MYTYLLKKLLFNINFWYKKKEKCTDEKYEQNNVNPTTSLHHCIAEIKSNYLGILTYSSILRFTMIEHIIITK